MKRIRKKDKKTRSRFVNRRMGGAMVEILKEQAQTESRKGKGHMTEPRIEKRTVPCRGKINI